MLPPETEILKRFPCPRLIGRDEALSELERLERGHPHLRVPLHGDLDRARVRAHAPDRHAPVVDAAGHLVGVLSEYGCLKLLAEGRNADVARGRVRDFLYCRIIEALQPDPPRMKQGRHQRQGKCHEAKPPPHRTEVKPRINTCVASAGSKSASVLNR